VLATIRTRRPITTNIVLDFDILIKQQFQKKNEKNPSEKEELKIKLENPKKEKKSSTTNKSRR
jgi:hypothetical protein